MNDSQGRIKGQRWGIKFVDVDEQAVVERLEKLTQEIFEIREANHIYWMRSVHNQIDVELYEKRLVRLDEIGKELSALARPFAA
jgi:hypothetical protein